jgi:hypothetical protein
MFDGDWLLAVTPTTAAKAPFRGQSGTTEPRAAHRLLEPALPRGDPCLRAAAARHVAHRRSPEQFGLAIEGMSGEPYFLRVETRRTDEHEVAAGSSQASPPRCA